MVRPKVARAVGWRGTYMKATIDKRRKPTLQDACATPINWPTPADPQTNMLPWYLEHHFSPYSQGGG